MPDVRGADVTVLGGGFRRLRGRVLPADEARRPADVALVSDRDYLCSKTNEIYVPFGLGNPFHTGGHLKGMEVRLKAMSGLMAKQNGVR